MLNMWPSRSTQVRWIAFTLAVFTLQMYVLLERVQHREDRRGREGRERCRTGGGDT